MTQLIKWVCQTDKTHIFDTPSDDWFCPVCAYGEGILMEETFEVETPDPPKEEIDKKIHTVHEPEVGLSVILMDASSSMTDQAFEGNPQSRMRLVASSAASGIFDLERMQNNPNAYVAAFKFDDRVELMFMDTVKNLIDKYDGQVKKFADYIYNELFEMQQGTDINKALKQAHIFVEKFMKKELDIFPTDKYTPMKQRILKYNSVDSVSIVNVRVLIYTDGMQYDTHGNNELLPNPFKTDPIEGLNHDIVIGAFFGNSKDEGCKDLKKILSKCPIHDEKQFFVFEDPSKIGELKHLFRMASGASGFCPNCLSKQLNY